MTNFWKKGNKLPHSEPGAVSDDPTRWLHDGGTVSEAVARDAFMVGGREVYAIRDNSSRWRKKPVEVDAWQVTYEDRWAVAAWCGGRVSGAGVVISTLEGDMFATSGDWVIRGVRGEFYPCKPDIFAATYEPGECWNCSSTPDDDWTCQACRTERGLAQDLADADREIERLRAERDAWKTAAMGAATQVARLRELIDALNIRMVQPFMSGGGQFSAHGTLTADQWAIVAAAFEEADRDA